MSLRFFFFFNALLMLYWFITVHISFTPKSTNYRGHIIDGTVHHPTFSLMSNATWYIQNHVLHIHSKQRLLEGSVPPTFSQTSSQNLFLSKNPHSSSLPMMLFQHVAVPQKKTSIISLAQILCSGMFFLICGCFPSFFSFQETNGERWERGKRGENRQWRLKESLYYEVGWEWFKNLKGRIMWGWETPNELEGRK